MTTLMEFGDKIRGERIICQYRKERPTRLIQLTGGHRGMQKTLEGYPAEAIIDRIWKLKQTP